MRYSRQREAILAAVRNTTSHPTADSVYAHVRNSIPGISLGTVYRNLRLLVDAGELRALEGPGGVARYDGCTDGHYHFRCDVCGRVLDIDEPFDVDLDGEVAARTGLEIRCHSLEFRGVCTECQAQSGARICGVPHEA